MYDNCMLSITAQRNGHDSKWEKNFTKPHVSIFIFTSSSGHPTPLSSSSNHRRHLTGVPPWWLRRAAANVQLPCPPPPASAAGFLQESESIALVFFCWAQHYVGLNPSSNLLPTSLVGLQTEGPSSRTRPPPSLLLSVPDQPGSMGSSRCPPAAWLFETQQSLRWWICGRKLCWWADGFVKGQHRRFCKLSFLLSDALTSQSRRAVQSKDF